ncbi:DUF6171 family protein [Paenibacillus alginolyticus]|uniref:DUF6171 family protein n=1 Tax=Paenibacillus alginolyticus TaxID=59839 RepID=UPI001FE49222|nr:DUF6171 family protein [Paenibacillus frigoriresistens]
MLASLNRKGFDCVSDEIYQARLAVCRECPSLAYGNTCLHCGCIVQIRAKFKEKGCPNPGYSKWQE